MEAVSFVGEGGEQCGSGDGGVSAERGEKRGTQGEASAEGKPAPKRRKRKGGAA